MLSFNFLWALKFFLTDTPKTARIFFPLWSFTWSLHCRSASSSHFQPSASSSWPSFQLPLPLLVWDHTWYTLGWFGVFFLCCFYALISPVPSLFHLTGMAFLILPFSPVGTFHLSLSILKIHTVIMLLWYLMRTVNTSECDCVACSLVFTWCKIMQ